MSHASPRRHSIGAIPAFAALFLATAVGAEAPLVRPEAVRAHVEFLASDALAGRGSGTRDELIAAMYAAAQLRQFGAEPAGDGGGYIQHVDLVQRELAGPPAIVVSPHSGPESRFVHGREVIVAAMAGPRIEAPLQKLDAAGAGKVRPGAAVFLADSRPPSIAEAIERGASIVLTVADSQTTARWESQAARIPRLAAYLAAFGEAPSEGRPTVVILGPDAARVVTALPEGSRVRADPPRTWWPGCPEAIPSAPPKGCC